MSIPLIRVLPQPIRGEWLVVTPWRDGVMEVLWRVPGVDRKKEAEDMAQALQVAYWRGRHEALLGFPTLPSRKIVFPFSFSDPRDTGPKVHSINLTWCAQFRSLGSGGFTTMFETTHPLVFKHAMRAFNRAVTLGVLGGIETFKPKEVPAWIASKAGASFPSPTSGSGVPDMDIQRSKRGRRYPALTSEPRTTSNELRGVSTKGSSTSFKGLWRAGPAIWDSMRAALQNEQNAYQRPGGYV